MSKTASNKKEIMPKISENYNPDIKTNKWGANQYIEDPRQKMCWELYINPKSKTFGNAKQSAIQAGYSPKSAGLVTQENWFISKYKRFDRVSKAEKVLDDILEMSIKNTKVVGSGDSVDYIEVDDPQLLRIKQDTAKFYLERLKKRFYSTRTEVSGKNGEAIEFNITEDDRERITKTIGGIIGTIRGQKK